MSTPKTPFGYSLVTPEGVDLRLKLATRTARMGALFIDLAIIIGTLIALTIILALIGSATTADSWELLAVLWVLGAFLLRSGYFTWFEAGPRAATPGKRALGIRVATADGQSLTLFAIFVRNILREVEVFIPLSFVFAGGSITGDVDGWITAAGIIWSLCFLFLPFVLPNCRRGGDLIAGTIVVEAPKLDLSDDMAGSKQAQAMTFNAKELDVYGSSELQVLEKVLREDRKDTMKAVAERIQTKIGRPRSNLGDDREFLQAYYNALRKHLEQKLLFGQRRTSKHDV